METADYLKVHFMKIVFLRFFYLQCTLFIFKATGIIILLKWPYLIKSLHFTAWDLVWTSVHYPEFN